MPSGVMGVTSAVAMPVKIVFFIKFPPLNLRKIIVKGHELFQKISHSVPQGGAEGIGAEILMANHANAFFPKIEPLQLFVGTGFRTFVLLCSDGHAGVFFRFGNDFGLFIAYNADFETCGSNEKAFENRSSGKLIKAPFGIDSLKAHTYWSFGLKF